MNDNNADLIVSLPLFNLLGLQARLKRISTLAMDASEIASIREHVEVCLDLTQEAIVFMAKPKEQGSLVESKEPMNLE